MDENITTQKEQLLLKSLIEFYKQQKCLDLLLCFLKGHKKRLSLRLLDWLVTNYCKHHPIIVYDKFDQRCNTQFMYLAYKNNLKSYSKKFFDAFARRQRIFYNYNHMVRKINKEQIEQYYDSSEGFVTTIAQLNAFRFFITFGIIDYAIQHLEEVEYDMIQHHKCKNKIKQNTDFHTFISYRVKMTVKFK